VINGKNIPSALNNAGLAFLINISTNCTVEAITTIKLINCKNGALIAVRPALIPNAHIALITITKVTAAPILVAVSIFPDTPKKGQIPRKYARTKLLIRLALIKMLQSDASLMLYYFLL